MFVSERLDEIIYLINQEGKVEVNKLSKKFNVSKDLIRKDLSKLEENGILERTYGGAVKKRKLAETVTITSRISKNLDTKQKIAQKALKLLKPKESIFLDISSINYILAHELIKNNWEITVITNMIDIMHLISLNPDSKVKLIGIGGTCNNIIDGFVGISSINQINNFNVDRCFIGTIGINTYNGNVSTYEQDDGLTKVAIMNTSKNKYLITEISKIDQDGKYNFSNLKMFDCLITDNNISDLITKELKKYKIKIV
ncbi:DeoR/GlpR family DNA-binding transcription regulator [Pseudoleptotrichia goodfellowii]|uniref:Transcriptional regulator, DeoR family n=1 Tax=Pseudoleptotrichia goodfellowii F0264 TaxID=596323 RepID=D0GPY4_9FUSO|nr:DeoR/GlpR family DNA-binding transcription regulator [Pseudoleptotrichia goodfellowii]EEY33850.1 transcriptional regulator, DeoR family [Pseudoleptotrichia goodfellowii F0264]MBF4805938.1 DeoR/GlpR transcriptional regulator [Pseudoleptotrichia goodfellowii]